MSDNQKKRKFTNFLFEIEGNTLLPLRDAEFGNWITIQRQNFKKNKLSEKKIDLLESIKFVWDPEEEQWFKKYQKLKEYFEREGNTLLPTRDAEFGNWIAVQRRNFQQNKLTQEKIYLLEKINFQWKIKN